jgi:2,3-bisphosphoglycerate-dependent phosphoglycerate mutase
MKYGSFLVLLFLIACQSQKVFVVRHGEKAVVTKDSSGYTPSNPPLSEAGKVRAFGLREELKQEDIRHIFSTNFFRTIATATPLRDQLGIIPIEFYSPSKDSLDAFIAKIKSIKKGNILIVGHSNTVDDIANRLAGEIKVPADLNDNEYNNLFILKRKNGKYEFSRKKYGY